MPIYGPATGVKNITWFRNLPGTARKNTSEKTLYNNKMESLPPAEVEYLNSFPYPPTRRLAALHSWGWSLSTLAQALNPPRAKSTVHNWITNEGILDMTEPFPVPQKALPVRSISPQVPPHAVPHLKELSKLARQCRSRTPKSSPYRIANEELTETALSLYKRGVPVELIASASNVSSRAMFRRIEKGLKNAN